MTIDSEPERGDREPERARSRWIWAAVLDNLPFVAIIVLGLVGSGWTSITSAPSARYWVIVTPLIAIICVAAGWREQASGERLRMVITQVLQWIAVLIAMYLLTISTVEQTLSANATGLMLLTVLALGVFVSGLHLASWKLCITGAFLAVSVPAIAWIQNAALLLLLAGVALIALLILYWWLRDRAAGAD
jgi:hypothetical protein